MNFRMLFVVNAVVVAVFGVLFLVLPDFSLTQLGVEKYVATLFVARFLGGALLMSAILIWFAKEINDEQVQKQMAIALLAGSVIGFVLTVIGIASSSAVIRANGWVLLVIYILFSLGYGFLLSGVAIVPKNRQQQSLR
jgi:hypothetical protein